MGNRNRLNKDVIYVSKKKYNNIIVNVNIYDFIIINNIIEINGNINVIGLISWIKKTNKITKIEVYDNNISSYTITQKEIYDNNISSYMITQKKICDNNGSSFMITQIGICDNNISSSIIAQIEVCDGNISLSIIAYANIYENNGKGGKSIKNVKGGKKWQRIKPNNIRVEKNGIVF